MRIKKLLSLALAGLLTIGLSSCRTDEIGGSFNELPSIPVATTKIKGHVPSALLGRAYNAYGVLVYGAVSLKDSRGNVASQSGGYGGGITDRSGEFTLNVPTKFTAPYLLQVTVFDYQGNQEQYYSIRAEPLSANDTVEVNISPLTDAATAYVISWAKQTATLPSDVVSGNTQPFFGKPYSDVAAKMATANQAVKTALDPLLTALQTKLGSTNFNKTTLNLFNTSFKSDHTGQDALYDVIKTRLNQNKNKIAIYNIHDPDNKSVIDLTVTPDPSITGTVTSSALLPDNFFNFYTELSNVYKTPSGSALSTSQIQTNISPLVDASYLSNGINYTTLLDEDHLGTCYYRDGTFTFGALLSAEGVSPNRTYEVVINASSPVYTQTDSNGRTLCSSAKNTNVAPNTASQRFVLKENSSSVKLYGNQKTTTLALNQGNAIPVIAEVGSEARSYYPVASAVVGARQARLTGLRLTIYLDNTTRDVAKAVVTIKNGATVIGSSVDFVAVTASNTNASKLDCYQKSMTIGTDGSAVTACDNFIPLTDTQIDSFGEFGTTVEVQLKNSSNANTDLYKLEVPIQPYKTSQLIDGYFATLPATISTVPDTTTGLAVSKPNPTLNDDTYKLEAFNGGTDFALYRNLPTATRLQFKMQYKAEVRLCDLSTNKIYSDYSNSATEFETNSLASYAITLNKLSSGTSGTRPISSLATIRYRQIVLTALDEFNRSFVNYYTAGTPLSNTDFSCL